MRTAGICLAWILVGLVAVVIPCAKANLLRRTPFPHSPEILAQKAREMIQSFGYAAPPADRAYRFSYDTGYRNYAEKQGKPAVYRDPRLLFRWWLSKA